MSKCKDCNKKLDRKTTIRCCECCRKYLVGENSPYLHRLSDILRENNIQTLNESFECDELWNINNGITLCVECHKTIN